MRLNHPDQIDSSITTLTELVNDLRSVKGGGNLDELLQRYLVWLDRAYPQLTNLFADGSLADQLWSRHWSLRSLQRSMPRPFDPLNREIDYQSQVLTDAIEQLRGLQRFRSIPGDIAVLDTSALMEGVPLTDLDWRSELGSSAVRLIIPILVLEELDSNKDKGGNNWSGDKARRVIKKIRELFAAAGHAERAGIPARPGVSVEVLIDDDWHLRRPIADSEIIDQAILVKEITGKDVRLVTIDASMEFRARNLGLSVFLMPYPPTPATAATPAAG